MRATRWKAAPCFGVGDGLAPVDEPLDACVISGMGGETMIGIMRRGMDVIKNATLILQPNVDPDEVREFLYDNGFCVIDEDLDIRRQVVVLHH